jgi:hypothetical protein
MTQRPPFRSGDKVRFLSTPLTRQLSVVGKYGTVLVGSSSTKHTKVMTPTRLGLRPWWFPYAALKSCAPVDPRPPVDSIVIFLPTEFNDRNQLTGETGIVIRNLSESAYCHIETAQYPDHCSHFSEIERIDL